MLTNDAAGVTRAAVAGRLRGEIISTFMDDDRGAIFIEDGVRTGFKREIPRGDLDFGQAVR